MTIIEIRPFRNGWQVYESAGVQPAFLNQQNAIIVEMKSDFDSERDDAQRELKNFASRPRPTDYIGNTIKHRLIIEFSVAPDVPKIPAFEHYS